MLKGSLEEFSLSDVFRLLSFTKKTGKLDVKRSAGEGVVFFRDGEVYFAQTSLRREPLGQKLIRAGHLTETQLMKALDTHAQTGERVGEILLQEDAITEEQLIDAVRGQIEDAAFDLLLWDVGNFAFVSHDRFTVEIPISVSVENLIIEASRRVDELEVIRRKIPSLDVVLGVAPNPPQGAREINITPDEWRLLVLVDGMRTVGEMLEISDVDEFNGLRHLHGLLASGLVEVAAFDPSEEASPIARPEPLMQPAESAIEDEADGVETDDEADRVEGGDEAEPAELDDAGDSEVMVVRGPEGSIVDESYIAEVLERHAAEPVGFDDSQETVAEAEPEFTFEQPAFEQPAFEQPAFEQPAEDATATEPEAVYTDTYEEDITEDTPLAPAPPPSEDEIEEAPPVADTPLPEPVVDEVTFEEFISPYNELPPDVGPVAPEYVYEDKEEPSANGASPDGWPEQDHLEADAPDATSGGAGEEGEPQDDFPHFEDSAAEAAVSEEEGLFDDGELAGADFEPDRDDESVVAEEEIAGPTDDFEPAKTTSEDEVIGPDYTEPVAGDRYLEPEPEDAPVGDFEDVIDPAAVDEPTPVAEPVGVDEPAATEPAGDELESAPSDDDFDTAPDDELAAVAGPEPSASAEPSVFDAEPVQPSRVDRAAVVRELASLFGDEQRPPRRMKPSSDSAVTPTGAPKRRVEDDDQINKGLIGRFIDGVKGI